MLIIWTLSVPALVILIPSCRLINGHSGFITPSEASARRGGPWQRQGVSGWLGDRLIPVCPGLPWFSALQALQLGSPTCQESQDSLLRTFLVLKTGSFTSWEAPQSLTTPQLSYLRKEIQHHHVAEKKLKCFRNYPHTPNSNFVSSFRRTFKLLLCYIF